MQLGAQAFQQVVGEANAQGALLPSECPGQPSRSARSRSGWSPTGAAGDADLAAAARPAGADCITQNFQWDVAVIQSDQANAFCLPGGKMAVYTGLLPIAQNAGRDGGGDGA